MSEIKDCDVFSPFPVCSYHGRCDTSQGKCICEEGWTSIGDFSSDDGVDCNINILSIQILHGILVGICILAFIQNYLAVSHQYHQFKSKNQSSSTKSYFSDPIRVFPLWNWMMVVDSFIYGSYRIANPLGGIGHDVASTLLASIFSTSYAFGATNFHVVVLKFLNQYDRSMPGTISARMKQETKVLLAIFPFFKVSGVLISLIPFFCFAFPNQTYQVAAAFHLTLCLWFQLAILLTIFKGINTMIRLLGEHLNEGGEGMRLKDEILKDLYKKLKQAKFVFLSQSLMITAGWLLIGLSPGFYRQNSYFLPILFINAVLAGTFAIKLISNSSSKSKDATPIHPTDDRQNHHNGHIEATNPKSEISSNLIAHSISQSKEVIAPTT